MRLNFWQWVGLVFVVIAVALIIWRETSSSLPPASPLPVDQSNAPESAPTTSTAPTTAP